VIRRPILAAVVLFAALGAPGFERVATGLACPANTSLHGSLPRATRATRALDGSLRIATTDVIYGATTPPSGTARPGPTPSPNEPLSGLRSGAGVIVALLLICTLVYMRSRLRRR
jgi:hypothetical protein